MDDVNSNDLREVRVGKVQKCSDLGGASIKEIRIYGKSLENKHEAKGMIIKLQVCYGDSKVNGIFLI